MTNPQAAALALHQHIHQGNPFLFFRVEVRPRLAAPGGVVLWACRERGMGWPEKLLGTCEGYEVEYATEEK